MKLEIQPTDLLQYQNRLRFPEELETLFLADYSLRMIQIARPGTALAILVYLSFWILDIFALPQAYQEIWIVRVVGILLMVLLLGISFTPWYKKNVVLVFSAACLIINLSVIVCFSLTRPNELVYNLYYITLIFVILGAPLLGLPFWSEVIVSGITFIVYLTTAIFFQHMVAQSNSLTILGANSFFLAGAILIGSVGAYFGEIKNRRNFLQNLVIEREKARSENLLLNIIPAPVAERLKQGERIADYYPSVSVLFADIVNFTPISAGLTAIELLDLLNEVFSSFDTLAEKYGVEKIKTIGDCYMAAAGVPLFRPDHAIVLVRMALDMQDQIKNYVLKDNRNISIRIGIHSGPLVAGIIGNKKFIYDLWGDSVNTASRMESHGVEGVIQITRATYEMINNEFLCSPMGIIPVKGKGDMEIWHVDGPKIKG